MKRLSFVARKAETKAEIGKSEAFLVRNARAWPLYFKNIESKIKEDSWNIEFLKDECQKEQTSQPRKS